MRMSTAGRNFQIAFEFSLLSCLFLRPSPSLCFSPVISACRSRWSCGIVETFPTTSHLACLAYALRERDFAVLLFIDFTDPLLYTNPRIRISPSSLHFFSFWLLLCLLCFCQPTTHLSLFWVRRKSFNSQPPLQAHGAQEKWKGGEAWAGELLYICASGAKRLASIGSIVFIGLNNNTQCVM